MMQNPFAGMFSIDPNSTPEQLARKRAMVAALMPSFGNARYVGQGVGQLATGVMMGRQNRQMDQTESANRAAATQQFNGMMGTGATGPLTVLGIPPTDPISQGPIEGTPDPNSPQGIGLDTMKALGQVSPYANGIAGVESAGSGGYAAVGPDTGHGRAYGKYQVMESNIPAWTLKYTGKQMTPEEFLNNPGAQEAVFNGEFGAQVQKYGNPQDAASVWFSGKPMDGNNASDGYNSVPEYVAKFNANMGNPDTTVSTMGGGRTTAQGGPSLDQLYGIVTNPWATPEQKAVAQSMIAQQTPDASLVDLDRRARMAGLQPGTKEYQDFMLNGPGGNMGLQVTYATDANGKIHAFQLGKNGQPQEINFGEGMTPFDPVTKAFATTNATEVAKNAATAQNLIGPAAQLADDITSQIDDLKNDPYLPSMLGPINSRLPNWSEDSARVQSKINQLKGGAFLTARQQLKGGGAITDYEGMKAEEALARMEQAQSVADFNAALDEFQAHIKKGLLILQQQATQQPNNASGATTGTTGATDNDPLGIGQ